METGESLRFTTAERIARGLREDILTRRLLPGSPLREELISKNTAASRHVVREALRLLVAEGVAEYLPFKGARVAVMSESDVQDIYQARRLIEAGALRLADPGIGERLARIHGRFANAVAARDWDQAFQLDVEFHSTIAAGAQSETILGVQRDLLKKLQLAHLVEPSFREPDLEASVAQHAEIVVALAAGDRDHALQALEKHLGSAQGSLTTKMSAFERSSATTMRPTNQ